MTDIQTSWERISAWLLVHAPKVYVSLRPGASEENIAAAETALSVKFPDSVRASFALHDGQEEEAPGLINGCELLSLERMIDESSIWTELLQEGEFQDAVSESDGPVRPDWWNPKWLPVTYDGTGNHHCIDLDPAEGGQPGQVIVMMHDDPYRPVIAPNFADWLEAFAEDLETGIYVYDEEDGGVVHRRDLLADNDENLSDLDD